MGNYTGHTVLNKVPHALIVCCVDKSLVVLGWIFIWSLEEGNNCPNYKTSINFVKKTDTFTIWPLSW